MPQGLEVKGNNVRTKVLNIFKTLYGARQIPRDFWKYMTSKMELCGMVKSNMDPCLFVGKKVMAMIYVDDILFWSVNENDIPKKAMQLRKQGVNLEQEGDAAGFMGATLVHNEATGLMETKQVGLIDCVIETLGLDNGMAKSNFTPSESKPLVKDAYGSAPCGTFRYSSVVRMLLNISVHTCLDI